MSQAGVSPSLRRSRGNPGQEACAQEAWLPRPPLGRTLSGPHAPEGVEGSSCHAPGAEETGARRALMERLLCAAVWH